MTLTPIKLLRISNRLRQADIEKRSGIPQPRYSMIERGVKKPNDLEMKKLSKVFGLQEIESWF